MTVIDCQWHWYPPAFLEAQLSRRSHPLCERVDDAYVFRPSSEEAWRYTRDYFDLERQLEVMDGAGIDVVVASPVIAGDVTGVEAVEGRYMAELLNEELARAQRAHPDRFAGLAVLPLQDVPAAIEVLDDAIGRLGLAGVLLHSNVAGASIAAPGMLPLYERMEALGVPVFLHPTRSFPQERFRDFALEPPLGYMFDTTVAALSLIVAGVLDRYPALKLVHPHLGGTLPYLADRVDVYRGQGRWPLERPVRDYLPRFFTDTVSESPQALRMAIELYGLDRLLFSSDWPYFPARLGIDFVRRHLDEHAARAVFEDNARRLLGR